MIRLSAWSTLTLTSGVSATCDGWTTTSHESWTSSANKTATTTAKWHARSSSTASYSPVRHSVHLLCLFLYFWDIHCTHLCVIGVREAVTGLCNCHHLTRNALHVYRQEFTVNRLAELEEQKPVVRCRWVEAGWVILIVIELMLQVMMPVGRTEVSLTLLCVCLCVMHDKCFPFIIGSCCSSAAAGVTVCMQCLVSCVPAVPLSQVLQACCCYQWLQCKIRGGGTLHSDLPPPDNGRVPFSSIITIWGGGTLSVINWRWGTAFPCVPLHFNHWLLSALVWLSWLLLCLSLTLGACMCHLWSLSIVFVFLQLVFHAVLCCGFVCSDSAMY